MGPNLANLFVTHIEAQIFSQFAEPTPDLYSWYIDSCIGAASLTCEKLCRFSRSFQIFTLTLCYQWNTFHTLAFLKLLSPSPISTSHPTDPAPNGSSPTLSSPASEACAVLTRNLIPSLNFLLACTDIRDIAGLYRHPGHVVNFNCFYYHYSFCI